MKHTIDDVKTVNPEFRMYHNRIGLFNSHSQNFKQFGVPKAQLMERRRQAMCDTRTLFDVNETKEDEK